MLVWNGEKWGMDKTLIYISGRSSRRGLNNRNIWSCNLWIDGISDPHFVSLFFRVALFFRANYCLFSNQTWLSGPPISVLCRHPRKFRTMPIIATKAIYASTCSQHPYQVAIMEICKKFAENEQYAGDSSSIHSLIEKTLKTPLIRSIDRFFKAVDSGRSNSEPSSPSVIASDIGHSMFRFPKSHVLSHSKKPAHQHLCNPVRLLLFRVGRTFKILLFSGSMYAWWKIQSMARSEISSNSWLEGGGFSLKTAIRSSRMCSISLFFCVVANGMPTRNAQRN